MSFFDTTPTGRILNRFSKDQEEVDSVIPIYMDPFLQFSLLVSCTVITIAAVLPLMLIAVFIIGLLFTLMLLCVNTTLDHRAVPFVPRTKNSCLLFLQHVQEEHPPDEEDGEHQSLSLHLPHHIHSAGPQHHPRLRHERQPHPAVR